MATSLQGHMLVAAPELRDPNFFHTVVLLVQHGDQGALGLVLNRASEAALKQVWGQISASHCPRNDFIYVGGPVEGPLMAVHDCVAQSETEVRPGIYFSAARENIEQVVHSNCQARFFVGFAGWGAGQLEGELAEGAWRTHQALERHVFSADENLWEQVLREIAGYEVLDTLHIKHVPPDPSMN